jgi:hypothetical protein
MVDMMDPAVDDGIMDEKTKVDEEERLLLRLTGWRECSE